MGSVYHLYQAPVTTESRTQRICRALLEEGLFEKAVYVGAGDMDENLDLGGGLTARHFTRPDTTLGSFVDKIRATRAWAKRVEIALSKDEIACVACHAVTLLPMCRRIARAHKAKLIYECHELETETAGLGGFRKKLTKYVERKYIGFCDAVVVVNESIAQWYRDTYPGLKPFVVRNLPDAVTEDVAPSSLIRDTFGIPKDDLVFITQGRLSHGRNIPMLLEAFSQVAPGRHLVVMGFGPLEDQVAEAAKKSPTIHFLPAVKPSEVVATTAGADVGISMIEPIALSYRFALPNKFFEYLRAGLPVASNDLPEQKRVIDQYGCGWMMEPTVEAVRNWADGLTRAEIDSKRPKVHEASLAHSWQKERFEVFAAYRQTMG